MTTFWRAAVLRAAQETGLNVPDDVAVVGFNDSDLAEPLRLTSVRQPFEESGETAVNLLLEQIASPETTRRDVALGVTLIERQTS